MISLLASKTIFAISIFALTLITGFIPLKIAKHNARFLDLCDAFASGIFLSTGLLHLLPDAVSHLNESLPNAHYPWAYLICLATFIFLMTLERCAFSCNKEQTTENKLVAPTFLILLLTIHSLAEGAAIGINNNLLEATAIFFAIIAHKGSESFALSFNLNRFGLSAKNIRHIILMFSLMTPLGIFIASFVTSTLENNSAQLAEAILSSIAAGTFLYMGTEYLAHAKKPFGQFGEMAALTIGIILMSTVAIWV